MQPISRRSSILLGERKTTVFQRFSAKSVDVLILVAIYMIGKWIYLPFGSLAAAFFAAFHDSFGNGQSIGKRIMGLRVIDDASGISCPLGSSLIRNLPLVVAVVFACVPMLWAFALFVSVPILILECYLVFMLDSGVRLGDVMANTHVVEHFEENIEA